MQYLLTQAEFDALTPKTEAQKESASWCATSTMRQIERDAREEAVLTVLHGIREMKRDLGPKDYLRLVGEIEWREFQKMPQSFRDTYPDMFIDPRGTAIGHDLAKMQDGLPRKQTEN